MYIYIYICLYRLLCKCKAMVKFCICRSTMSDQYFMIVPDKKYYIRNMASQQYLACQTKKDRHGFICSIRNFDSSNRPINGNGPQDHSLHQEWLFESSHDDDTFYLKNVATEHYLDCTGVGEIYGRNNYASGNYSNGPASNNVNQQWKFQRADRESRFFLKNRGTGYYLDSVCPEGNLNPTICGSEGKLNLMQRSTAGPESDALNQLWQLELSQD